MTTAELITYYSSLLVIQYKTLPNAVGTVQALATEVVADQIYAQVRDGFAIPTAIGKQLDVIAQYVGAPRDIYAYDPSVPYFAFPSYSGSTPPNVGFAFYADVTDPVDFWLSYTSSETTYVLTDGQLRQLIQYLIAVHMSDHTLASIDVILQSFFGNYATLTDNGDMSITYTHLLSDPNILFSIVNQLGLLPHPAGVEIIVTEV